MNSPAARSPSERHGPRSRPRARQGDALDTRLIDLPRHQIARLLDDAMASVSLARPGDG